MTVNSKLPEAFIEKMKIELGGDFSAFIDSFEIAPPVSVRVNPFKYIDKFKNNEPVPWATNAFYLPERISFTLDPLFHAGCYYVQEASSMYVEQVINKYTNPDLPLKVLDLCAAPGGKSTHLISVLPKNNLLVCNEVIGPRNNILQQNITKWGTPNVIVTQNAVSDFNRIPGFFDIILVDAPCSGEGLFRKDPEATTEWNPANVNNCALRQNDILDDIIPSLKEDGILIYSTCTYEEVENDAQVERLCNNNEFELLKLEVSPNISKSKLGLQFYPHKIKGEGFYIAALRKKSKSGHTNSRIKSGIRFSKNSFLNQFINDPEPFTTFVKENKLYAIPMNIQNDFEIIMKNLYIRQAGICIGTLAHNDLVPDHSMAMSIAINSAFPVVDLTLDDSISFLKCESVHVSGLNRGWYLAKYDGFALGWMKSVGTRINNYYPKHLRILKQK